MGSRIDNAEDGHTLAEILIALAIFSVVVGLVGSVFIFISAGLLRWQESTHKVNEQHLVSERVFADAQRSISIIATGDSMVFEHETGTGPTYCWADSVLQRNGKPIFEAQTRQTILRWEGTTQNPELQTWILFSIEDEDTLYRKFHHHSRKRANWEKLKQ